MKISRQTTSSALEYNFNFFWSHDQSRDLKLTLACIHFYSHSQHVQRQSNKGTSGQLFSFWRKTGKLKFITISNPPEGACRVSYFPLINISWFWIWTRAFIEYHNLPDPFTRQHQMSSVWARRFSTLCLWLVMANLKRRLQLVTELSKSSASNQVKTFAPFFQPTPQLSHVALQV